MSIKPSERIHFGKLLQSGALAVARSEIGNGEIGENNAGPHVDRYRAVSGKPGSRAPWCASFVSWCYLQAAERNPVLRVGFKLSSGAKRLTKNIGKHGRFLTEPEVGAVICWRRGSNDELRWWKAHIGIITAVDGNTIKVIEGNKGRFPARVRAVRYPDGDWRKRLFRIATVIS